jgi:hypothetical protein
MMAQSTAVLASAEQTVAELASANWWPLAVSGTVYAALTTGLAALSRKLSDGHFIYPIDDVYIHLAVAKHVALHGVWGISPFEFSSTTSSPLFVLILAAASWIAGANPYLPLALSWLAGLGAISVAAEMLREAMPAREQTAALLALVLLTPLFSVGILGMEHSLHLLLTLLFLRCLQRTVCPLAALGSVTALMVACRYEGLLVAAAAVLVLCLERAWARAATVAMTAGMPVVLYAAFSMGHGGSWLPNSVALKGLSLPEGTGGGMAGAAALHFLVNAIRAPWLLLLVPLLLAVAPKLRRQDPGLARLAWVTGAAALLHLLCADVGGVFRYEAYLLGVSVPLLACAAAKLWPSWHQIPRFARVACLLLFASLGARSVVSACRLPLYAGNIYRQQWQVARFLDQYYTNGSVAANDIGAINEVADLHCLDMVGLASREVFLAKKGGYYTTAFLESQAEQRGVQVAVIYDSWFTSPQRVRLGGPQVPASWIRVRRWSVPEQLQLGDRTVSFYAVSPTGADLLRRQLDTFQPSLPKAVSVTP